MEPLGYGVLPTVTDSSWMTLFVLCCARFFLLLCDLRSLCVCLPSRRGVEWLVSEEPLRLKWRTNCKSIVARHAGAGHRAVINFKPYKTPKP